MDIETFRTLTEVLAFECKDDPSKRVEFARIFYGNYKNPTRTVIDLDAMMGDATLYISGRRTKGYVSDYSMSNDEHHHRGVYGPAYSASSNFTLTVTIKGSY